MAIPTFNVGGLLSGLDTNGIVSQLMQLERQPMFQLQRRQSDYETKNRTWDQIATKLNAVQDKLDALKVPSDWQTFAGQLPADARLWFIEQGGPRRYDEVTVATGDYLVFGRETAGLPAALLAAHESTWVRIPMFNEQARSLNLSNCVSLVLYNALRQQGFVGELAGRA